LNAFSGLWKIGKMLLIAALGNSHFTSAFTIFNELHKSSICIQIFKDYMTLPISPAEG
jgi:hypothetical protein